MAVLLLSLRGIKRVVIHSKLSRDVDYDVARAKWAFSSDCNLAQLVT